MTTLSEAKQAALDNRRVVPKGDDPLALRKAAADVPTLEEAATAYIEKERSGWTNPKHAAQWTATLERYVFPRLRKLPVSAIDTGDVRAFLDPIWTEKPETADRVKQRAVLMYATALEHRIDNPAGDALKRIMPKRKRGPKRHHRALPHREVAAAIETVRGSNAGIAVKLAFEFLILTAARSGEVRLATWNEGTT